MTTQAPNRKVKVEVISKAPPAGTMTTQAPSGQVKVEVISKALSENGGFCMAESKGEDVNCQLACIKERVVYQQLDFATTCGFKAAISDTSQHGVTLLGKPGTKSIKKRSTGSDRDKSSFDKSSFVSNYMDLYTTEESLTIIKKHKK